MIKSNKEQRFFKRIATTKLIKLLETNISIIRNTQDSLTVISSSAVINEICDELKLRYSI